MKKIFYFIYFLMISSIYAQSYHYTQLGRNDRLTTRTKHVPSKLKMPENCVDDIVYKGADIYKSIENFTLDISDVKVTDEDINKFGNQSFEQIKKSRKYRFITQGKQLRDLQHLLKELLRVRRHPSFIKYHIHLIESNEINAFTVGGHIIITTGIIKEAETLSAVAAVIGHEIGHNEKGHLSNTIKKIKLAKQMGSEDAGRIGVFLQKLITPAFNQPNEIEADLYGVDLCYAAGFNPKASLILWKKLSKKEYSESELDAFLRTHPYSKHRLKCIKKYLKLNYHL